MTVPFKQSPEIIAYLADWAGWDPGRLPAENLTRLNYAFALVSEGRVTGDHWQQVHRLKDLKQRNPALKTVVSIGGWGADGFSDAALTEAGREAFAQSALALMKQHDFDGIDVDWEYPCRDFAAILARPEDKENFTRLMETLRRHLDAFCTETGRRYLLTIAAGAAKMFAEDMELDKVAPLLDSINIMTYDFHTVECALGHHTNLYPSAQNSRNSGCQAVEVYRAAGVPTEKIVLGAAFYGRGWTGLNPEAAPFGQSGQAGLSYPYKTLAEQILPRKDFRRYWDDPAKAPYLFNGDTFITYDDPESLYYKVRYVRDQGLQGIMFWEWSEDKDGTLLDAIVTAFNG